MTKSAIGLEMDQLIPTANVRRRSAQGARSVVEMIESNIAAGVWRPGDRLPTERELEIEFGTARNTLRKGLQQLEAKGTIIRHVGRGTFVAEPEPAPKHESLIDRLIGCSPAEVMEVRLMVEPLAAEFAATRANQADLAIMRDCVLKGAKAADVPDFEHWDGLLHKTIIDAARNNLLSGFYEAINAIRNQPEWLKLKRRSVTPARRQVYQAQHEQLVAALFDRDMNVARETMLAHLLIFWAHTLNSGDLLLV